MTEFEGTESCSTEAEPVLHTNNRGPPSETTSMRLASVTWRTTRKKDLRPHGSPDMCRRALPCDALRAARKIGERGGPRHGTMIPHTRKACRLRIKHTPIATHCHAAPFLYSAEADCQSSTLGRQRTKLPDGRFAGKVCTGSVRFFKRPEEPPNPVSTDFDAKRDESAMKSGK